MEQVETDNGLLKRRDVDLFYWWRRKLDYNWTRSARHGGKAL